MLHERNTSGLYENVPNCGWSLQGGNDLPRSWHCEYFWDPFECLQSDQPAGFFQDGIIIENMHDVPYSFTSGPEVVACMTAVCCGVRSVCPSLPLGVQILSAANQQALAVALASGSLFTSLQWHPVFKGVHHFHINYKNAFLLTVTHSASVAC